MKLFITTGCGNIVMGGSDIWVNNFIKNVIPTLPDYSQYKLLIDSKKPVGFDDNSIPNYIDFHHYYSDPTKGDEWLSKCSEIIFLHSHYHNREHIWKWERKFKTIFIHAYPRDMIRVMENNSELSKIQLNTKVDSNWYDQFLLSFTNRVWIGNNYSEVLDEYPINTFKIPNYYEFMHNMILTSHVSNGKIGFASRAESRKCIHWLNGHSGYALTNRYDVQNLKDTHPYQLNGIKIYQWNPDIQDKFMRMNWGIFHGAYFKEPFGYSIFQAVDYGKLPILHKDWAPEVDYKYRVSTKNEFDKCVSTIVSDSHEENNYQFELLKSYMKKFDNKEEWISKIKDIILI